jgi:5-methylcytosine-specific restriction endonuclease McrA
MRECYYRIISPIATDRIKNNCCPNCGKPKSEWKRRIDWRCCSIECTQNYYKEFDKSYSWETFRKEIFKRDNATCKKCGKRFVKNAPDYIKEELNIFELPDETKLIADHIIPIKLGGAMWEFSNIQTLCIDCNKIKTKTDIKNISKHRKRNNKKKENVLVNPFVSQERLL